MRCANAILLGLVLAFWGCTTDVTNSGTPEKPETPSTPETAAGDSALANATVEIGCAKCSYKMEGVQACALAAKVKEASMLITGVQTDVHDLNLCEGGKTRPAVVDGKIEGGQLVATKLEPK